MKIIAAVISITLGGCVATVGGLRTSDSDTRNSVQSLASFSSAEVVTLTERNYGAKPVPFVIYFPRNGKSPYPLIIHQHGSSRDGFAFEGSIGHTDEHGSRIRNAALASGYAVAVLDAFEGKGLAPSDKSKFPKADQYANQLRNHLLSRYPDLDSKNTFYTGFSYGGDAVMAQLHPPKNGGWKALVAAEPSCNANAEPSALPYPVLILKGTQSHYYPIACQLVVERHQNAGNPVELSLLEGGNHYFSLHGEIIYNGLAFNGCSKNPIFIDRWRIRRYDGSIIQREDISKCFTREGGKGKSRELLDEAIRQTIAFFDKHRSEKQ